MLRRRTHGRTIAGVAAAVALSFSSAGAVGAEPAPVGDPPISAAAEVVVDGLVGPLHLDAPTVGRPLVSQSFAGVVSRVERSGELTDLIVEPGNFIGGVAAGPFGSTYYLSSGEAGAFLKVRDGNGATRTLADLGAYESRRNPDAGVSYGLQGLDDACLSTLPDIPGLAPYTGVVDSNPYELTLTLLGVLVADAAGNDILLVDWSGRIRTIAVLPPLPTVLSADAVAALGLDPCVEGATLNFEPVPTDVELGPNLQLYVSALPGGPEDPGLVPVLGARGGVFRVNPFTGTSQLLATGFAGSTNVAVAPGGAVYVAELFAGRVSKLVAGGPQLVAEVNEPAALEFYRGDLMVTTDVNGNGALQRIDLP